jgi:hypothetical protein
MNESPQNQRRFTPTNPEITISGFHAEASEILLDVVVEVFQDADNDTDYRVSVDM